MVHEIKDLGVTFDNSMSFINHIELMLRKSNIMLGFIMRNTQCFSSHKAITVLYNSFVRSKLEYASNIWSPYYTKYNIKIEKIQNKFLRYIKFKISDNSDFNDYQFLREITGLDTLSNRRIKSDCIFIFKILNGLIDCNDLLQLINLRVPVKTTRNQTMFQVPLTVTNYLYNKPLSRMLRLCNSFEIDWFNSSIKM